MRHSPNWLARIVLRRAIKTFLIGSLGLSSMQVTAVLIVLGLATRTGAPLRREDFENERGEWDPFESDKG